MDTPQHPTYLDQAQQMPFNQASPGMRQITDQANQQALEHGNESLLWKMLVDKYPEQRDLLFQLYMHMQRNMLDQTLNNAQFGTQQRHSQQQLNEIKQMNPEDVYMRMPGMPTGRFM